MDAFKYQAIIKDGQLDLPPLDLPEGTIVEAILLIKDTTSVNDDLMDETDYLLSSPANREHLERSIAQYKKGKISEYQLIK